MRTYLYDTTTEKERESSHRKLGRDLAQVPPGFVYCLTLKQNKPGRSLPQNAFYHVILTIYANYVGCYLDEIKGEFYDAIGYYTFHTDHRGKEHKRYKSSADEDTPGMARLITQLLQWGSMNYPECDVPGQDTMTERDRLEIDNQYQKALAGW